MKRFLIATLVFIVIALMGILCDALFLYEIWDAMPNLLYYGFGWLAAGIYIAISNKLKR